MKIITAVQQKWGNLDISWRFAISAFLAARLFYALWSWVILSIQPVAVHYVESNGAPAILFLDLHSIQQHTYLREVNGSQLNFRSASRNTVSDLQTGSKWDINTGVALEGYFKGTVLTPAVPPIGMFSYFNIKPYPNAWLGMWQRFDANWYTSIAMRGYVDFPGSEHFPPLFPLIINLATHLIGNPFMAGLVISHLATMLAIKFIHDLFMQWSDKSGARSVFYFLIFPSAFFLFSVYSESLFLVMALLAFRSMEKRHWSWAGFWIFCATLTRLQGVALGIPLLYLLWKDKPFLSQFSQWFGAGTAGAGILFYFFMRAAVSTEAAIPISESIWPARLAPPWEALRFAFQVILSRNFNHIDVLNMLVFLLIIFLLIKYWSSIPLAYNLYTAFGLLAVTSRIVDGQPLSGMLRFSLTLFPVFFALEEFSRSFWMKRIVSYTFLAINLYLSAEFFGWGWVA